MTAALVATNAATAVALHTALEMGGIAVGMRLFARRMRSHEAGSLGERAGFTVALGCIVGAIVGSRIAVWLDRPDLAMALWSSPRLWLMGQSIVGALLGGLVGVEIAKRIAGVRASTGDRFVVPLTAGIAIGRIGCFVAGLHDDTYGVPTTGPFSVHFGVDFGDGVPRHPTQLYEIAFVLLLALVLRRYDASLRRVPGLAFKLFLSGYLVWRIVIDALKPVHFAYPGGFSGLQVLAVVGLACYLPFVLRDVRKLR